MEAFAIVWGPNNKGVTIRTSNGNTALAVFHEYREAAKVLIEMDEPDYKIIEVRINQA